MNALAATNAAASSPPTAATACLQDTLIYSATCPKLGGKRVAVKVYDKTKVQATKYRAIKREIAMMMYFMKLRRAAARGRGLGTVCAAV